MQVWAGPLSRKRVVVVFWNRVSSWAPISVGWKEIGLSTITPVVVRDLWAVTNNDNTFHLSFCRILLINVNGLYII